MSNYKAILLSVFTAVLLHSCMPKSQSFCYDYTVNKDFFAEAMLANDMEGVEIDFINVYRATLVERLVERDAVPEYKLVNTSSDQSYAELADSKNYHHLYLFQLFPKGKKDIVIVYMATSFAPNNICTGLGPVYTGTLDTSDKQAKIQLTSILKIKRTDKKDDTGYENMKTTMKETKKQKPQPGKKLDQYGSKACEYGELKRKYELLYEKETKLIFLPGKTFTQREDSITLVRVGQIIRRDVNKIGGTKAVIFTTNRVFGDPDALVFTYFSTIK